MLRSDVGTPSHLIQLSGEGMGISTREVCGRTGERLSRGYRVGDRGAGDNDVTGEPLRHRQVRG